MTPAATWKAIPFATRRKVLDALASPGTAQAVAEFVDRPPFNAELGPEMTHIEEHALATALAILEEVDIA